MAIVKKLTEEELAVYEIIRHPIWCSEFLRDLDLDEEAEEKWEYTNYQEEFLCDFNPYVSICCGRTVGKTVALIDKIVWLCINLFWNESIVYTVPNKVHLEPVFLRLTNWFRRHPFLKHYTGRTGINSQSFTIKLYNGAVVDCRIAGQSGTGANVVGLHVPILLLDEAGFYPWGTWIELMPTLNTWQEGFQLITSGVPTGRRDKNVLYFTDQRDDKFTKHRITAHENPRYSDDDEVRNVKQFGGLESEDYVHLVLGHHGAAAYALFDRQRMFLEDYNTFRGTVHGTKLKEDKGYLARFYNSLPAIPRSAEHLAFGVDLGYTDPTIITVLYRRKGERVWRILVRATFRQVPYPIQEGIIDKFDSLYNPKFLGIDEGSSGKAVIQHLVDDQRFKRKRYKSRIVPVQFRSMITVGIGADGEETKVRAKQFGMQLLQSKVNEHEIHFSNSDEALIGELERTTYTRTPTGELVFKTATVRGGFRHSEDHNVSALICFAIALYMTEELGNLVKKVKLYKPRWSV